MASDAPSPSPNAPVWGRARAATRGAGQRARRLIGWALGAPVGVALVAANDLPSWLALPAQWLGARLPGWLASRLPLASGARPDGAFTGLVALLALLALLAAFACYLAALRPATGPRLRRATRWLAIPALLWALLTSAQSVTILARGLASDATQRPPQYVSDELYYNHAAALLTLHGENPYVGANEHLIATMRAFHIRGFTPLARGRFSDPWRPRRADRCARSTPPMRPTQARRRRS